MKTQIGLWIDHNQAIIVTLSEKDEMFKIVESHVKNNFEGWVIQSSKALSNHFKYQLMIVNRRHSVII